MKTKTKTLRFTLREYDYVLPDEKVGLLQYRENHVCIPRSAFDYLDRLLAYEEEKKDADDHALFLRRTSFHGRFAFQVQNHVGVIQTPCGTQIEILPKVGTSKEQARYMLVSMLWRLPNFPFRLAGEALLDQAPMHLMEVFIKCFLQEVSWLVKKGIRSDYVPQEEDLPFLKGRLLVAQNLRFNPIQKQRFWCAYDEFLPNCPENRLIRRALDKVFFLARAEENRRLCRELLFVFHDVPASLDVAKDFSLCRYTRSTTQYRNAMQWCRMILEDEGSLPSPGQLKTLSMLFPMERVFESYVGWLLAHTSRISSLRLQASERFLVEFPRKRFRMRPDFLFSLEGKGEKHRLHLGDAKWKQVRALSSDIAGIAQADLYQLYAYGKKHAVSHLWLFYPENHDFRNPVIWTLEKDLKIAVVPVPLPDRDGKETKSFAEMISYVTQAGRRWL